MEFVAESVKQKSTHVFMEGQIILYHNYGVFFVTEKNRQ